VIAYVVSGIGFLGAGVIMRQEGIFKGLNTAATLWCSAAVSAAGCDRLVEAILATIFWQPILYYVLLGILSTVNL
jgi:putative Mg2+ transporter-C (MgtC) family protein